MHASSVLLLVRQYPCVPLTFPSFTPSPRIGLTKCFTSYDLLTYYSQAKLQIRPSPVKHNPSFSLSTIVAVCCIISCSALHIYRHSRRPWIDFLFCWNTSRLPHHLSIYLSIYLLPLLRTCSPPIKKVLVKL